MELLFELILQIVFEVFGDLILHGVASDRRSRSAALGVLFYALVGALAGWITLYLFPEHFIADPQLRLANLIVTPLAIGGLMATIGYARKRADRRVVRLEQFLFAFVFALAMAAVRFFFAG